MNDLIVVVPGITGSVLRRNGRDTWNLSLSAIGRGLTSFAETIEDLRLPRDVGSGPAPSGAAMEVSGLIDGWHLWPGIHGGPGYRRLLNALHRAAGDSVRSFGYDWRLSNRQTGHLLAAATERWLGEWRAIPGNSDAKVIFVCHSMGGLAARYYLEVLGGRDHTRRIITLGTPYRGSVKAIRALTGDAFTAVRPFRGTDALIEAAQSFPALWELLPTYRCFSDKNGPISLRDARLTDLPTDAITHGLEFHEEISAAVKRNSSPPYEIYAFAGKRQITWQSVTSDNGQRQYSRKQRGQDYRGDGTVPLFSAVPPEWTDTGKAICRAVRHGGLCADTTVLDLVLDKINPLNLGDVLTPACELGVQMPEVADSDKPVEIWVDSDRQDLLLRSYLENPATGDLAAGAQMISDGDGGYSASLEPIPGTWRLVVETIAERPVTRVEDLIYIAPK